MASFAKKLIPILDRILVQKIKPVTQTKGGLLLPESSTIKVNQGIVLAAGPGGRTRDGTAIPMAVKEGDTVLLPDYGGSNVKLGGEEFTIYRDEDILAIIKE
jgi:chaperonin GroES